jgi:hypothetical protein
MIVSYSRGFVFVANPKAASTSVESALAPFQERADLNTAERPGFYTARHMPAIDLRERLGRTQWDSLFTFGVIRHPCDWLVSQLSYNYRRLNLAVPEGRQLTEDDVLHIHVILKDRRGQSASLSGSQWAFLCSESRMPLVTQIVTLESLHDRWDGLMNRIGAAVSFPGKLNRTHHPPWTTWLDEGARGAVEVLWKSDFDLYRQASTLGMLDDHSQ